MTEKLWARIENGIVEEIVVLPDNFTPGVDIFSSELSFTDVTDVAGIAVGWTETDGKFSAPPSQPASLVLALKQYAALVRYQKQNIGLTFNGAKIDTSVTSQGLINGAITLLNNSPNTETINFKSATGVWTSIPRANMIALGVAIGTYIQDCFNAEQQIDAAIDAGTITTTDQVDGYTWPPTTISSS